jgi:hypothetical protein
VVDASRDRCEAFEVVAVLIAIPSDHFEHLQAALLELRHLLIETLTGV